MITPRFRLLTIAVALSALAGFVDALGFLSLGGFFVAFMSGNSARLALALVYGDLSVAATIVTLATALQVRVNAEGVETDEQWFSLCKAGCTEFQGFLTGRPLPAVQLLAARTAASLEAGYRAIA